MAEGDGLIYNAYKEDVMSGVHKQDTGGDTLKQILVSGHVVDIDLDQVLADVVADEYATGLGYTAGGETILNQVVTQNNAADRGEFDADDNVWTALGPLSPAQPSHTIMYNDTPVSPLNPLIASWELGTTPTNGGDYTLQWGANGIILLT